jgi:Peptidyl-tRNA hydrolase PTH2
VVTREDLSPGYQGVQSIHAAIQFAMEHPETNKEWFEQSNYLGFLSVANELELNRIIELAAMQNIKCSVFKEPDIDNQITAIALAPGAKSKKLCSNLKLALKDKHE